MKNILKWFVECIDALVAKYAPEPPKIDAGTTQPSTPTPVPSTPAPAPVARFLWDNDANIRKSIRKIADDEGMPLGRHELVDGALYQLKDLLCATIYAESGFKLNAINYNKKNGKVVSTDHGLCQVNDFYHIGPGKTFPSVEYVYANPEAVVRWMCRMWMKGHRDWWIAYRSGLFKKYL